MKKKSDRRQLPTRLCRMFYTSTFGFFIFTILNDFSNANRENLLYNNGTLTEYQLLNRSTWLSGFNECKNVHNLTMASADDIGDFDDVFEKAYYNLTFEPVWTYAFEIKIKSTGKVIRIKRNWVSGPWNAYTCIGKDKSTASHCCTEFLKANSTCQIKHKMDFDLLDIHPQTLEKFALRIYTNTTKWVQLQNESEFIDDKSGNLSVRCLLLDKNGKLWTDDCNKNHRTLCLSGVTQHVVQYVDRVELPVYKPPETTTQSTGRSSKSPVTSSYNDSNNTKPTSINPNPESGKQDFWMDPQIRYSIIGVGCFIVVAILTAVCCCCCRKGRKGGNKRKSTHLADAYSETADSIVMKETSIYETADTSEYAIPEDALKKARQRKSIGENEYDVLQKTNKSNKTPQKFTGNTYNHVTLVSSKDRRGSSNQEENTYDVTNYGKQNSIIISPNNLTGNQYGEVTVKVESDVKTKR